MKWIVKKKLFPRSQELTFFGASIAFSVLRSFRRALEFSFENNITDLVLERNSTGLQNQCDNITL